MSSRKSLEAVKDYLQPDCMQVGCLAGVCGGYIALMATQQCNCAGIENAASSFRFDQHWVHSRQHGQP